MPPSSLLSATFVPPPATPPPCAPFRRTRPKRNCAREWSHSAARRYHFIASARSLVTPWPVAYMNPRLDCATAWPLSASGRSSRSAASNLLRLLNLADPVQTMLMAGDLDMGHARALLSVDAATQVQLAQHIVQKQLSVRETERLVAQTLSDAPKHARAAKPTQDGDTKRLVERLSDALGAQVELNMAKGGKGKMTIAFAGLDVLQGIIEKQIGRAHV